jgi:twinkle protein
MAQVIHADEMDFAAYLQQTEASTKVRPAGEWVRQLIDDLGKQVYEPKAYLPWEKSHPLFAFRPGEVTLWAGVNGHGKSLMTGLASLSLIAQEERCAIASFEMKPRKTIERMARQWSGQRPAGDWMQDAEVQAVYRDLYEQFDVFTQNKLWLYDQQGTVKRDVILGVMRYCAVELRIKQFVLDSLMKCVAGEDDYNGQKAFIDEATSIARDTGMHVHVVHHLRKLGHEGDQPDKSDVKGTGAIADQVDNILLVWRNKKKEADQAVGKAVAADEPDARLICCKQRNGEWEGRFALWFDAESQQYLPAAGASAMNLGAWPHRSI